MEFISFKQPYRWYAVYTKSRAEKKVHSELVRKQIECYLPLISVRKQWSDRIKVIEEPLLKGYILVKVSNKEYYDVLVTQGALHYVSFGGKPALIPDCQVDDLKVFMSCFNCSVEVTSERISKGDYVRVIAGPLKNVNAEVVEIRGRHRILLRFNSLGYCVHTELGVNKVELIVNEDVHCV